MTAPSTHRLFVAVFPPEAMATRWRGESDCLAALVPPRAIRWTNPEQIHLTLFFLGDVELARLPEIQAALRDACRGHPPFRLRARALGCFPSARRPRILWAGLEGELGSLRELKAAVDERLAPLGFAGEERPFHPHVTLGRISAGLEARACQQVARALESQPENDYGEWEVGRINLMRSRLAPAGATYERVEAFVLAPEDGLSKKVR